MQKFSVTFNDLTLQDLTRMLTAAPVDAHPQATFVHSTELAAPAPAAQPINNDDYEDDEDAPTTAAPELDADGLPWDERIHGKNKTKNADGRWRKRKGAENVEAIEAELKAKFAGTGSGQATAAQAPQPAAAAPAVPPMPSVDQAPAAAPPMPTPAAPQPPAQPGVIDGPGLMLHITQQMQQQGSDGLPKIEFNYLTKLTNEIATAFNVPISAITDILHNQQQVTYAVQCLQRDGKW